MIGVTAAKAERSYGLIGIRGMPSFLLFRQGQVVESMTGVAPKSRLAGMIDAALQAGPGA